MCSVLVHALRLTCTCPGTGTADAEAHERAAAALEADSKVALEALAAEHSAVMVQLRNEAEEATAAAVETAVRPMV